MLETIYQSVRPYGGTLWVCQNQGFLRRCSKRSATADLPRAKVAAADKAVVVVREGALPGSADWTHLYGNVANTVKSDEQTVKLPLGVLWFGGNSNEDVSAAARPRPARTGHRRPSFPRRHGLDSARATFTPDAGFGRRPCPA